MAVHAEAAGGVIIKQRVNGQWPHRGLKNEARGGREPGPLEAFAEQRLLVGAFVEGLVVEVGEYFGPPF